MPLGLMCYSEPRLLLDIQTSGIAKEASLYTLFRFVKQHYKTRWVFLLLSNLMFYEKKWPFSAAIYTVFFNSRNKSIVNLDKISVNSFSFIPNSSIFDKSTFKEIT